MRFRAFWWARSNPLWIAVADIDGDGHADVLMPNDVPNGSGGIAILKGRSDGSLAPVTVLPIQTPFALLVGDVDGDGVADLVWVTQGANSSIVTVLRGDGHGNFQQLASSRVRYLGVPVTEYLVDLDGDGELSGRGSWSLGGQLPDYPWTKRVPL